MSGTRDASLVTADGFDGGKRNPVTTTDNETITKTEDIDDDRPVWSELKTKAGKERKRLPLACIACRRKKIRCSGETPACKHCSKARIPCVYKVTLRKPAPRTDYMAMLDRRLKRMEDRVIKLSPSHDASKLAAIGRSTVKPYVAPSLKSATSKKRAAEEELNDWANAQGNLQLGSGSLANNSGQIGLLQEGQECLPSQAIQEHLSEVYFDHLYGQSYHVLHKPSYMRKLKAGKVPPVLILTICALSARYSNHPQLNTEPAFLRGEEWAKPAREISLRRYDEPSITISIVYLLLGLHEFGTCQGGRSWMFGGMALRMAYALQLHHELDHDSKGQKTSSSLSELSHTDCEIRRRTMWACFLMDRFNSSGTNRPVFAFEESIEIQLPIQEFKFQMEIPGQTQDINGNTPLSIESGSEGVLDAKDNMGLAAYIIKVVSLWGRVVKYVNLERNKKKTYLMWEEESEFSRLKHQLKVFMAELPEGFAYNADTLKNHAAENQANQLILLHIIASQITLFLHKFAIPANPAVRMVMNAPKDFINQSMASAVEAAVRISLLLKDAMEYRVSAPFAGYCAFAASTIHIWCMFSNTLLEKRSKNCLVLAIRYLTEAKKYWGMFHHMIENLKNIYKQHAEWAMKGGQAVDTSRADTTIFQYGDWFDTYPRGVSSVNFEDPVTSRSMDRSSDDPLYEKPELSSPEDIFKNTANLTIQTPRKTARKQSRPKSGRHTGDTTIKPEPDVSGIPDDNHLLRNLSLSPNSSSNQTQSNPEPGFINYEPGFYPEETMMSGHSMHNQPLAMAELDRQLVLGAYSQDFSNGSPQAPFPTLNMAGQSHLPLSHAQNAHQLQHVSHPLTFQTPAHPPPHPVNPNTMLWDVPPVYGASEVSLGQDFQDALGSSAWLMPFNIVPPDTGMNLDQESRAAHYSRANDVGPGG